MALSIIPDYSDGSVYSYSDDGSFFLRVSVTPAKYIDKLLNSDGLVCKADFRSVITKAAPEDPDFTVVGEITSVSVEEEYMTTYFTLTKDEMTRLHDADYMVSFSIEDTDGSHGASTSFVPVSSHTRGGYGGDIEDVGVGEWDDKVSGNTAEVNGHTVSFNCPEGLKYGIHIEWEASGSFDGQTDGTLIPALRFSYDNSAPSVPQDKFLSMEGPASGCRFSIDKKAHTITVTDVTADVSFNLSLGKMTFIPYTATAKVEPKDKKIAGLPLDEEKSTFEGINGVVAIDGELTAISKEAFKNKTALTSITLPSGITEIGADAFDGCTNLSLPALPEQIETIGVCAFRNAGSDTQGTSALVLPGNLTTISGYAFEGCRISSLSAGEKLLTVGAGVFKNCKFLTEMTFKSDSAPGLGGGDVFYGIDWSAVSGIFVNKSTDHGTLFNYKKADGWKDIPNGVIKEEGTTVTLIPYTATARITLKTGSEYSLGDNTEYISDELCSRYDAATGKGEWFLIGEGTAVPTQIPRKMFNVGVNRGDNTLLSISIPEGVKRIGDESFTNCGNLTSISFPTTLETIGENNQSGAIKAFQECSSLTSIDLSGCTNLKVIPERCFSSCSGVTSLKLPESLESIGNYAFTSLGASKNGGLQSLILPKSLTFLGTEAFRDSEIKSITLTSSQTDNAKNAFSRCSVETLTLEDGSNLGSLMFENCRHLKTITSKSQTPPDLHYNNAFVFKNCSGIETIYVPAASVDIYKAAEGWSQCAGKIKAIGQ